MSAPNNPYRRDHDQDSFSNALGGLEDRIYDERAEGLSGRVLDALLRSAFTDGAATERRQLQRQHQGERADFYDEGYEAATHDVIAALAAAYAQVSRYLGSIEEQIAPTRISGTRKSNILHAIRTIEGEIESVLEKGRSA